MRRELLTTLVAAALMAGEARADGLRFDGDTPLFPHFFVTLEAAQRQVIASEGAKGVKYVELRLTAAQQAAVKKESGANVPWVFAVSRKVVEGDCTCGSYNLAVVIGDRLAVYKSGLGDHLSPGDLKSIEAKLRGNAPPEVAKPANGSHRKWVWLEEGQPRSPALEALLGRFPGGRFERTLRVAKPWRAARVQVPALPRLGEESDQDFVTLFSDPVRIAAQPVAVDRLTWPTAGARLEGSTGTVTWLLPAVASPGIGPAARAWALFEYREGKLAAVVALPEEGAPVGWVDDAPVDQHLVAPYADSASTRAGTCVGVTRREEVVVDGEILAAVERQLGIRPTSVHTVLRKDRWTVLRVSTHRTDDAHLFYKGKPTDSRYVALWGGAARKMDGEFVRTWVLENAPGIPGELAVCFARYMTGEERRD